MCNIRSDGLIGLHKHIWIHIVGAEDTVGKAELHKVYPGDVLDEGFFGKYPAKGRRREVSPAVLGRELIGSIGADGEFGKVSLVVSIAHTACAAEKATVAISARDRDGRIAESCVDVNGAVGKPGLIAGHRVAVLGVALHKGDGRDMVGLTKDDISANLEVIDNGVGLDSDNMKHIFERFYQGGNSRRLHIHGTGIGLNLCKMIVDMHHGTISAHNRTDERGTVFTVTLPLGCGHLSEEEIDHTPVVAEDQSASIAAQSSGNGTGSQSSRYKVLIVDDDMEISRYISAELARYYKFGICSNGREGLKELLANDYDLVISDVMMPEMDGFTMLRMIKTNINISHIPVIMLTSKADVGNRLEGLERGADAFLAKPFDLQELHSVIDNLIHNRQRLKGKYTGAQQQTALVEQPEVKGNDELLMERIMKSVNKNLSNSDFNVDMLTQEVGISRAQLHRKMKEMTGISTSEFIRNIRLEQAARLLREQKINITQVAYTVGFSNLAHFSTIFRKHFGISPSEYMEQNVE